MLIRPRKRAYPQGDQKGPVEFSRHRVPKTTYKKRERARHAGEQKQAYPKRWATFSHTRPPGEWERSDHPTTDEQKWSRAKTGPTMPGSCAESPDPTIGAGSPLPNGCVLHET